MSGGVDSSVSAALLKKKGYDVIGITMDIWPAKADATAGCCSASAVDDAKHVADKLGIPHYTLNFRDVFKETVVNDFIKEYSEGRTPNPCVRCNQFVKFEHLLRKADELGAELLATGHYAVIVKGKDAMYELHRSPDRTKDQSYFLYGMSQAALRRTLFPVGDITKTETRKIAKELGLRVADKKDSQEICFIEDNNYGRFLAENVPDINKPGPIIDTEGNRLGMHRGIAFYTVGQRKGIGVAFSKPYYVVKIDRGSNTIVIGDEKETLGKKLSADNVVWTSVLAPSKSFKAKVKIRHGSVEEPATVTPNGRDRVDVVFSKNIRSITPGQSAVFYKGDMVIGGGIIC